MKSLAANITGKLIEFTSYSFFRFLLIVLAILVCYGHTLDAPFYLDDLSSIQNNTYIRSLNPAVIWEMFASRIVGYYTFALNYAAHGSTVTGYHAVNILIHILSSLAVYLTTKLILKTPALSTQGYEKRRWLPLLVALVFAVHPLQIQAVTYIVQRLTSLAAMLYLGTLLFYLLMRLSKVWPHRLLYLHLTFFCFILAFFTKQNAATAPLSLLIAELIFFRPNIKKIAIILGLIIALGFILYFLIYGTPSLEFIDQKTRETYIYSRSQYFNAQLVVVGQYLWNFIWPVNLVFFYDADLPSNFLTYPVPILAALHIILFALACYFYRRFPVVAFGIIFYYTAHLVESSFLPIKDLAWDHRTYLPNFGLSLLTGNFLSFLLINKHFKKLAWITPSVLVFLTTTTWLRNNTWRNTEAFFTNEINVNNDSFRGNCSLGITNYINGNKLAALEKLGKAWSHRSEENSRGGSYLAACGVNYAAVLQENGLLEEAKDVIATLPLADLPSVERSKILGILANIDALEGKFSEAEIWFLQSIETDPYNIDAIANLAKLKILTGELDESFALFEQVISMDPGYEQATIGIRYIQEIRQLEKP